MAVVTFMLAYIGLKVRDMLYHNNGELVTITTYFDDGNTKNPIFSKILKYLDFANYLRIAPKIHS